MASFLEKVTSTLNEAKNSVTATAGSIGASLTESVKTEAATAPEKVFDGSTEARDAADNALSRGVEGVKYLLHVCEEKRTEVSSELVGAVTNASSGASSSITVASRDLPVSTDNQPLLASGERGVETTSWWKECCGVLDLIAASNIRGEAPRR